MTRDGATNLSRAERTLRVTLGRANNSSVARRMSSASRLGIRSDIEGHMKYSENRNYRDYMDLYASGDLNGALGALENCLNDMTPGESPAHAADLLQRIGTLEFELGRPELARACFEQAEQRDPGSLLVQIQSAKFLAQRIGDQAGARAKCEAVIAKARSAPFPESDEDFGSDDYIAMAMSLLATLK
jgi:tetratricopeptide (TPR) repeat protein